MAFTLQLTHLQPATYPITGCPPSRHCLLCRHSFLLASQLASHCVVCWGAHRLFGCSWTWHKCAHRQYVHRLADLQTSSLCTDRFKILTAGQKCEVKCPICKFKVRDGARLYSWNSIKWLLIFHSQLDSWIFGNDFFSKNYVLSSCDR